MKTKGFTILAIFSLIPLFFVSILFGAIGADYWLSGGQTLFAKTLSGEVNNKMLAIMCIVSLFSLCVILTYMLSITRNSTSIDKLDQKLIDLDKEIQQYREAKEKFIKKTLET